MVSVVAFLLTVTFLRMHNGWIFPDDTSERGPETKFNATFVVGTHAGEIWQLMP